MRRVSHASERAGRTGSPCLARARSNLDHASEADPQLGGPRSGARGFPGPYGGAGRKSPRERNRACGRNATAADAHLPHESSRCEGNYCLLALVAAVAALAAFGFYGKTSHGGCAGLHPEDFAATLDV